MPYNEALAGRIRTLLAGRPGVEEKKMFGGLTFMVDGQMCCGVLKDDMVARVDSDDFDQLVARPHVRPFDFSGRPMVGMVYIASAGLSEDQTLREWVQRALDYVAGHPKVEKSTKRRR